MENKININDLIEPKKELVIPIKDHTPKGDYEYGNGKEHVKIDINKIIDKDPGDSIAGHTYVDE